MSGTWLQMFALPAFNSVRSPLARAGVGVLIVAALAGCSTSKDEQEFYERGWLWPRGLDTPDRPVTPREQADAAAAARDPRRDW